MRPATIVFVHNSVTFATIALGLAALGMATTGYPVEWTLLGAVILGTTYDFCSTIFGRGAEGPSPRLEWYNRINFAALCFGIPFTSLAATFGAAELLPESRSAALAGYWLEILVASLLFGGLFLFARYKSFSLNGSIEYTLDKSHPFTKVIFISRRMLLISALVVSLLAVYEGLSTPLAPWFITYGVLFVATVPLHILHRPIASMVAESLTLFVLFYGYMQIF